METKMLEKERLALVVGRNDTSVRTKGARRVVRRAERAVEQAISKSSTLSFISEAGPIQDRKERRIAEVDKAEAEGMAVDAVEVDVNAAKGKRRTL